jgi:hypothetical protein
MQASEQAFCLCFLQAPVEENKTLGSLPIKNLEQVFTCKGRAGPERGYVV